MAEKIIKNSARKSSEDTAEYQPYVPQYRSLGVSPDAVNFPERDRGSSGEKLVLPNVGNNEEHFWTKSLDQPLLKDKESELYLLVAKDKLLMSGTAAEIQKNLERIFYQDSNNIDLGFTIDDVVVFKKMNIKIGIFFE